MSILIKSGEGYYEIPDDVLKKCKISKEKFEKESSELLIDVASKKGVEFLAVDLTSCCMSKQSLWASCRPPKK